MELDGTPRMLASLIFLAEQTEGQPQGSPLGMFFPLIMIGVLFYLMMYRPMKRQEHERQQMIANLKKNDKVLLTSGIYGSVVSVADKEDEVVVKVDDNVRLKVTRGSIGRNITQEEAAQAAKTPPQEAKTGA
jgi:preprotein translocase subunit YajC